MINLIDSFSKGCIIQMGVYIGRGNNIAVGGKWWFVAENGQNSCAPQRFSLIALLRVLGRFGNKVRSFYSFSENLSISHSLKRSNGPSCSPQHSTPLSEVCTKRQSRLSCLGSDVKPAACHRISNNGVPSRP